MQDVLGFFSSISRDLNFNQITFFFEYVPLATCFEGGGHSKASWGGGGEVGFGEEGGLFLGKRMGKLFL